MNLVKPRPEDDITFQATNVHKSYGKLAVLKGVDIKLGKGEVVALVGSSGAGKSTLLHVLGTLDQADQGEVSFNDINLLTLSPKEEAYFRNHFLGFVFQFHHLLPEFTALENASMPGLIAGEPRAQITQRATELLDRLGLKDRTHHKPSELSGGEQQRVAIARALMNRPAVILADEPTGNLDTVTSEELTQLIRDLAHTTGVSFLIATHDTSLAKQADRVLRIKDGVIMNK